MKLPCDSLFVMVGIERLMFIYGFPHKNQPCVDYLWTIPYIRFHLKKARV